MTTGTAERNGTNVQVHRGDELDAMARLPRDLALIKMENDTIMTAAAMRPINHAELLADIRSQLTTYRSFAETAVYEKPCGKDPNTRQQVYARGLSIRAAEAIKCAMGYNRCRADVTPLDDSRVKLDVSFTDYRSGQVFQDGAIVSKVYKGRDGSQRRWDDDRFYNVVLKAEISKRLRECILRCVPPGLKSELMIIADEQIDSFLDDKTMNAMVAKFSGKKVTPDMLATLIGKSLPNFTKGDKQRLLGVWNALEDGETTVAEVFGEANGTTGPAPVGSKTQQLAEALKTPAADDRERHRQEQIAALKAEAEATKETPPEPSATITTITKDRAQKLRDDLLGINNKTAKTKLLASYGCASTADIDTLSPENADALEIEIGDLKKA